MLGAFPPDLAACPGVRVLMLSWEYPPLVVGGLGRHVDALSRQLVAAGHEVCVITRGDRESPCDEVREGVRVRRAATDPIDVGFTTESLLAWSQAAEHAFVRAALPVVRRWRPDVIHAHDWLVTQTAITIAGVTGCPIVATIHAMETGRHQGWLPDPLNRAIHSVERWLVHESAAVITCSGFMREEVTRSLQARPELLHVVPNGIDTAAWRSSPAARRSARAHYQDPAAPLLVFAGRLVHEKGVQTILAALPTLRARYPGLRLVVAGSGPYEAQLRERARVLRVSRAVSWAGFVGDVELAALLGAADALVVPSLYEPFGLIALEAAAARTPLAVADTGGLRDLVEADLSGVRFTPGDPRALAEAVHGLLADPRHTAQMAARAARTVHRDFGWAAVAARTSGVYADACGTLHAVPGCTPGEGSSHRPVRSAASKVRR